MSDTTTTADLDHLRAAWLTLESRRADIVAAQDGIKAEIRRVAGLGRHPLADGLVDIQPNRRFNAHRAGLILPGRRLSVIVRPAVDSSLARKFLDPDEYADCQTIVGDPRVRIR